jgi:hypothetical protein
VVYTPATPWRRPEVSGSRILALAALLFWTLFCLYGAATGLLNLLPTSGEEPFAERILRLGIRLTLWAFIWFLPLLAGILVSFRVRRRRKPS